jgi:hypothetical protein
MLLEDFHDRWVPVLLAYDMHCGWKDCGDCNARDTPSTVPYHKTYREEMLKALCQDRAWAFGHLPEFPQLFFWNGTSRSCAPGP